MTTYLVIITTVLVITQIIRLAQNTMSLRKQNQHIKKQLKGLYDITQEDIDNQRKAYKLVAEYFEAEKKEKQNIQKWLDKEFNLPDVHDDLKESEQK